MNIIQTISIIITIIVVHNDHTPFIANTLMVDYEHETPHDLTKRHLIDCIADLSEAKTELAANHEELVRLRTQLFDIKNEQLRTNTELLVTKQELRRQKLLVTHLSNLPSPTTKDK